MAAMTTTVAGKVAATETGEVAAIVAGEVSTTMAEVEVTTEEATMEVKATVPTYNPP